MHNYLSLLGAETKISLPDSSSGKGGKHGTRKEALQVLNVDLCCTDTSLEVRSRTDSETLWTHVQHSNPKCPIFLNAFHSDTPATNMLQTLSRHSMDLAIHLGILNEVVDSS